MNQINIKEYFKTEKEKLRLAVIEHDYEPPSLTIVDATDGDVGNQIYIKKKIEDFESVGWPVKVVRPKDKFDLHYLLSYGLETDCVIVQMPTAERFDFDIEDIPSYFDCDGLTKNALVLPALFEVLLIILMIVVLIIQVKLLLFLAEAISSVNLWQRLCQIEI